jgi:hypothetical protein
MFGKILIANRGDNHARSACVAVEAHAGAARVKARSAGRNHNHARSACVAVEAHAGAARVKARSAGRNQIAGD